VESPHAKIGVELIDGRSTWGMRGGSRNDVCSKLLRGNVAGVLDAVDLWIFPDFVRVADRPDSLLDSQSELASGQDFKCSFDERCEFLALFRQQKLRVDDELSLVVQRGSIHF
jgi:hypothetical protein